MRSAIHSRHVSRAQADDGYRAVYATADGVPELVPQLRAALRDLGGEIVVEANAAGLRTLAGHLFTLAQDGTPDGTHLHLEKHNGLQEESARLVLERRDDE
jgi:hypothetical protein